MQTTKDKYHSEVGNGLLVRHMEPGDAEQLEKLQKLVFPTLAEDELIRAGHYLHHLKLFPEGQFVVTDGDKVIGMTTTMRSNFDFRDYHHTFSETIAGGWLTNHDPQGEWLYGLDIGVDPAYRGQGLARLLYRARQDMAAQLGLRGQITVGMMSGYGAVKDELSGEEYYRQLVAGIRKDPTLTPQMKIGFEPIALIPDYVKDPVCGNYGVLITLDISKKV